ncbi:MAG: glycosyl transferase [Candidatus Sumerlaeia bacterium]|nr:glycosyl transferase [Candidatus Sumerlaeia bacterium]
MTLRESARRLGVGRLVYRTWHQPRGFLRRCLEEGPVTLARTHRGRREMERAVDSLPPVHPPASRNAGGPPICFLTGHAFRHMTALCAATLLHRAGESLPIHLLDDGTLTAADGDALERVLGDVVVEPAAAIESRLDEHLPASRFPTLRRRRIEYPHLRKLTDVHAGCTGCRVVLDSDMIFHRRPDALLAWLREGRLPLHMIDCQDSYGYSMQLMEEFAGHPIPSRLNVGVVGLDSATIDWETLERWAVAMLEREGSSYYQEQALVAMMLAGRPCDALPATDYVCMPDPANPAHEAAVLHHYVAESRHLYFQRAWRPAVEALR